MLFFNNNDGLVAATIRLIVAMFSFAVMAFVTMAFATMAFATLPTGILLNAATVNRPSDRIFCDSYIYTFTLTTSKDKSSKRSKENEFH
jgi:hypothetical protein